MNSQEFKTWQRDVNRHLNTLNNMVAERKLLKKNLENHLERFFNFQEIEYDRNFEKIRLKWDKDINPIIRYETISELNMDFEISSEYDDKVNRIVVITIYPFGRK